MGNSSTVHEKPSLFEEAFHRREYYLARNIYLQSEDKQMIRPDWWRRVGLDDGAQIPKGGPIECRRLGGCHSFKYEFSARSQGSNVLMRVLLSLVLDRGFDALWPPCPTLVKLLRTLFSHCDPRHVDAWDNTSLHYLLLLGPAYYDCVRPCITTELEDTLRLLPAPEEGGDIAARDARAQLLNSLRNIDGDTPYMFAYRYKVIPCVRALFEHLQKILPASSSTNFVDEDLGDQDAALACIICLDKKRIVMFQPCCHFVCCHGCSVALKQCPNCRSPINRRERVYA